MNLIWSGTDALMLLDCSRRTFRERLYFYAFRIMVRMIEKFIGVHYVNCEWIADDLKKFGVRKPIVQRSTDIKYDKRLPKIQHDVLNVLYYFPKAGNREFNKWLYGYDIYLKLRKHFYDINFIEVDGSQDLSEVYPLVDFCVRCNRHDGNSRMIRECQIQGIPYYWSITDPDLDTIIKSIEAHEKRRNIYS